jgi:aspartate-semialdehyde dehydrogenase
VRHGACRTPTTSRRSRALPILISAQGGDYTTGGASAPARRGLAGLLDRRRIDAAHGGERRDRLDPVNLPVMQAARERGIKDFIGGNCTVSLMLMAVGGLMRAGLVEWITAMTYQSASGAGAQTCANCSSRWARCIAAAASAAARSRGHILDIDRAVSQRWPIAGISRAHFGVPLAASLIPWIDKDLGQRPEPRGMEGGAEANKIMGTEAQARCRWRASACG